MDTQLTSSHSKVSEGNDLHHAIVIVGAGSAGISVASRLKFRDNSLDIAIIDPADAHYYQPGWTMVGGGIFKPRQTRQWLR